MPEGSSPSRILRESGLKPRKRLGQNFLQDRSVLRRIVEAANIEPDDRVVEIGAGTGILTAALAVVAKQVIAIELDDALQPVLKREVGGFDNVTTLHANALEIDPCSIFSGGYKLIANIPYYITGPLVRHFLETSCQPQFAILMVQREVAQRMTSQPGALSLLGVSVQYYAEARIVARVPAGAFYPRPKVDSALVRLTPHRRFTPSAAQDAFFALARAGFGSRRKQLVNSLAHGLELERPEVVGLLAAAAIAPERRAETLTVAEWEGLAARFLELGRRNE